MHQSDLLGLTLGEEGATSRVWWICDLDTPTALRAFSKEMLTSSLLPMLRPCLRKSDIQ